jgi:hypothetical protein
MLLPSCTTLAVRWRCFVARQALAMALFSTTDQGPSRIGDPWRLSGKAISKTQRYSGYKMLQDVTRMFCFRSTSIFVHFCWVSVIDTQTQTINEKGEILFFEKRGCNPLLSECDPCPSVLVSDLLNSSTTRPISIKPIGSEMVNPQMLIMRTIHLFGNLVSWHFHVSLAEFLSWTPNSEFQATCKTCF